MDVLPHGEITHTLVTRETHTRRRCDGGESVADCFLPPLIEYFISTGTNCRCFQTAYFLVLHFSECICVKWLLTESRVRVRECVYHSYVYGNTVCEPVLYVHPQSC